MKTSNKSAANESLIHSSQDKVVDPFAVDFFGTKAAAHDENSKTRENFFNFKKLNQSAKKSDWFRSLPQISQNEAEFSIAIQNLPEEFNKEITDLIAQMIARYTFRQSEKVSCSIISIAEKNINESINNLAKTPQIFFSIACLPDNSTALLTINTEFTLSVIDVILGSQASENAKMRDLSPIENTITEFIIVTILSEINNFVGQPLFTLQKVETQPTQIFAEEERGAEIVFFIEIDGFSGILTAFLPRKFLNQLDNSQNLLLANKIKKNSLKKIERLAPAIEMNVQVGTTFLDINSLLFLETDDIVIVENAEISLDKGLLSNNLQVCAGKGRNFRLQGSAETKEFDGEMFFKIKEIFSEETNRKFTPIKLNMEEKSATTNIEIETEENFDEINQEEIEEQISPALENIQVALRVQIAADKITLRELQKLHNGQIIALGCRPNDPVRLVTDNNEEPVALGELVEIEGQLGVRLTKVFI